MDCIFKGSLLQVVNCSCRKLECESILCCHIFNVLQSLDFDKIPQCCIIPGWTTKAKAAFPLDRYGEIYGWSDQMELYRELRSMGSEAFFKASMSKEVALRVKLFLKEIIDGGEGVVENETTLFGRVLPQSTNPCSEEILDPANVMPKGAPTKRLRSCLEKSRKAKRKKVDIV